MKKISSLIAALVLGLGVQFAALDDTVAPDDQQAYLALRSAGFVERSTADPLSCCIHSYDLTTGSAAFRKSNGNSLCSDGTMLLWLKHA